MTPTGPISLLLKTVLSGGVALGAMLCAMSPSGAEVGVTAAVNVDARGRPPGGAPRVLALGANIVHNEQVTTDGQGLVQILLLDGTTFTVGPNSDLTIDEFVYNPATGDAKVVASLTRGVFRFVGARTSQTEGGATVKTPVGTIGIRGAVSNVSYDPATGETKAALVAGDGLTITGSDGTTRIVYEAGYTAVITQGEGGSTTTTIRKSTPAETRVFQQQLAGKPGKNGGTGNPPTDQTVEDSGVEETNSGLPDTMTPPGSPKPVQSSGPELEEQTTDNATQDDLDNEIKDQLEETPPPNARVLTAADTYIPSAEAGGGSIPNPGPLGLVGSTPETDLNVTVTVQGDRLVTSDGLLDLPDYTGVSGDEGDFEGDEIYPQLDEIPISLDDDAFFDGNPLSGKAYAGRGDFAAYLLGIDDPEDPEDPYDNPAENPVYIITGTPTTDAQLGTFTDSNVIVREYALTEDPIGQSPMPFFRDDLYGTVNEVYDPGGGQDLMIALNSTNLFIVESENGGDVRAFQSWVHISGEGDQQKSAAFLFSGGLNTDNGMVDGGRRGTYRTDAYLGPLNMRGGAATLAGGSGDHMFGENADHFVIGANPSPADYYTDAALDSDVFTPDFDGSYGTHHVASLVGETPMTEYGQPGQPTRTTRDITGFISGMGESSANANPYVLTSAGAVPNLTLHLDSDTNTVQGTAEVFDVLNQDMVADSYLIGFGRSGNLGGGSAFVDDHIFGAQKDNDPTKTRLRTDGGDDVPHTGQFPPGTYLVSGRANPIDGYHYLEGCEECDFIDWGWWGTRVEVAAGASDEIPEDRADYVHMGTWVAGDVATDAEIETLVAGTTDVPFGATVYYSGTVIGNVARETDTGTASYIATGDLNVNYNFSSRSGGVNINNFDNNVYLSGSIGETDTLQSALVGGALTGDNVYTDTGGDFLNGSFSGAFVNNPAAEVGPNVASGVIGNFDFTGAGVNAVGTAAANFVNID